MKNNSIKDLSHSPLKIASPWFAAVKRALICRLVLILPVWRQKVKGIGPGPLEVSLGSREQEPARTADRTVVTASFGHDFNT